MEQSTCPRCGAENNGLFWPPSDVRRCLGCKELWVDEEGGRPATASERRLVAVLGELKFGGSTTASERLEAIEAKLKEAGAPESDLAVEMKRARAIWNEKVPEPKAKAVDRLAVESVVHADAPTGYRSPGAPPRRELRVRTRMGKKATKSLAVTALILVAMAVAMHVFLEPTFAMIATVDGFVALVLLAFANEFAFGSSVEVADGVVVIRRRYLIRTTKTVRIPVERIAKARLVMRPRVEQQPQVVTVEVVEKDGTVHLVADYMLEEVGKSYVALIEDAVLRLDPLRVRVDTREPQSEPAELPEITKEKAL